jgi:hypothetical protein
MDTEKTTADSEGSPAPKKDKKPSEQAEASIQPQASAPLPVKLDLTVNHAPIEIRQEPVQVAVTHEPMQVTVTQEPIKIELSQADIHLHQQVVQQAAPKTKKVAIRDDDGLIVEMREVPDED